MRRLQMEISFPNLFWSYMHTCRGPYLAVPMWFHMGMVGESDCEDNRRHCRSSSHQLHPCPCSSLPTRSLKVWRSGHPGMRWWRGKESEKWCWMAGHFQIYLGWSCKLIFFLNLLKAHPLCSQRSLHLSDELYHLCRVVMGHRTSIYIAHINSDQNMNTISLKFWHFDACALTHSWVKGQVSMSSSFLTSDCCGGCKFKWSLSLKLQMSPVKSTGLSGALLRHGLAWRTQPTKEASLALSESEYPVQQLLLDKLA